MLHKIYNAEPVAPTIEIPHLVTTMGSWVVFVGYRRLNTTTVFDFLHQVCMTLAI